ncbi:MAG: inorganic diphosphatase [Chitinophagaceae bacterium]|nr:inorganic diphosphatase [Chitinophagaceae bacterium]
MAGNETVKVTIETPGGSRAKYDFDPVSGSFELNKVMPAGMVFPFDFGFIPGTLGEDGDPLDVLLLSEVPVYTGCVVNCRIIGCIKARQKEKSKQAIRNDRFIAVPVVSKLYGQIRELSDLPAETVAEVEQFFMQYNGLAGKRFTPLQCLNASKALQMVRAAQKEKTPPAQLIQLFLPLQDAQGKPFPQTYFTTVQKQLLDKFGGVTVYSYAPASGLWENEQSSIVSDKMLIFEVMADTMDIRFWEQYKSAVTKKFRQKELLLRNLKISVVQ